MGKSLHTCAVPWCTASAKRHGGSCGIHCANDGCSGVSLSPGASDVCYQCWLNIMGGINSPQPRPQPSDGPAIWDLVLADMNARDEMGERKYGTRLKPHNGRDALTDAYQEALDLAVYLRQAIYERDGR